MAGRETAKALENRSLVLRGDRGTVSDRFGG